VLEQGRSVAVGGARQRTLLALLLTRANDLVSTDRLIDVLWGHDPPRTPANALQYHVSQLRKALGPDAPIVTRGQRYGIEVGADELDLLRFERLVEQADGAAPADAVRFLRDALALWRGDALGDLADEQSAKGEIARLEELRLLALERRIEADRLLGRDRELVAELESLVRAHPLRESFRGELMRALYRSGRQADALAVYREGRAHLVEELGLDPSPGLQELEQAILRQDPALAAAPDGRDTPSTARRGAIVVLAHDPPRLRDLLAVAEPLAKNPPRELILARLLADDDELASANAELAARRAELADRGVSVRVAAYTTSEPGADTALLATEHDVDLVLLDPPAALLESGRIEDDLSVLLDRAPCDVGLLVGAGDVTRGPVVTPFAGVEHDWSAIELAAWLAGSLGTTLRLLGTKGDPSLGRRDASRLLARASLLVQQVVGIVTDPVLVEPGEQGVLEAAHDAGVLVVGLSERWRAEGLGTTRLAVASGAGVPTLFVRRGLRPSGVAPPETMTRFTWTIASPTEPQATAASPGAPPEKGGAEFSADVD
jgi:DNA-binding SARP family transcriptional activator